MGFDSETAFESALIKCLVEEKGWKDGVIKYPTEKDLLKFLLSKRKKARKCELFGHNIYFIAQVWCG